MKTLSEAPGSVASSAHGIPRTTMDIDLVVDPAPDKIEQFVEAVRGEFYADAGQIREAFTAGFGRRTFREIQPDANATIECAVSSMEDTILRKLERSRAGGETSEREWSDVPGMWNAAGSRADMDYLRQWAKRIGVDDLLEKLTGS